MSRWLGFGSILGAVVLLAVACDSEVRNLVSDLPGSTDASSDAAGPAADASPPAPVGDAALDAMIPSEPVARCGNRACACDDGLDGDGDGLADGLDPECTSAFDDDEGSFATGTKAPAAKSCRDCYWDGNTGNGDDSCRYPEACLRGAAVMGNGNCQSCEVTAACVSSCAARAPNGCDCFGCCELALVGGGTVTIELSETCSLATLDDLSACPRCVQNTACRNPCGRCELCPGRRADDLPPDCAQGAAPGAPAYRCDEGQPVCRTTGECPADMYCQLGCCLASLL